MTYGTKEYRQHHAAKHRAKKYAVINAYKAQGCAKCGTMHPAVLQLHHRDPDTKRESMKKRTVNGKFNNQGFAALSWAALDAELAKCDVLCANCHFILHWDEGTDQGE